MTAPSNEICISVNGEAITIASQSSIADLAQQLDLPLRGVAIALNGEIVARSAWGTILLESRSKIEVVSIAAGG